MHFDFIVNKLKRVKKLKSINEKKTRFQQYKIKSKNNFIKIFHLIDWRPFENKNTANHN